MYKMNSLKKVLLYILIICTFILPTVNAYSDDGQTVVYITRTGKCYHREYCSYLKSKIETTLSSAISSGYRACSRCKPPEQVTTPSFSQSNNIVTQNPGLVVYHSYSDNTNSQLYHTDYSNHTDICMGDSGTHVLALQNRLLELGYNTNGIDGNFGEGTKSAVIRFQSDNHLEITGIADTATQALLFH